MPVVSVSMPAALIEQLDEFAAEHEYTGRSEVVRESARTLLSEFENESLEGRPLAGVVSICYDFGCQDVEREITRLRHEHEALVASNAHSHVGSYCMELFVLEGNLEHISGFIGRVRAISGVETVEHSLLPLDAVGSVVQHHQS